METRARRDVGKKEALSVRCRLVVKIKTSLAHRTLLVVTGTGTGAGTGDRVGVY